MKLAFIILISTLAHLFGATIIADSTSAADVQTAINSAGQGDTVLIPQGTNNWASKVSVSYKSLSLMGAGTNLTAIGFNTLSTSPSLEIVCDPTNFVLVSDFACSNLVTMQSGGIAIYGTVSNTTCRVTRLRFDITPLSGVTGNRGVYFGDCYGLIDHCYFINNSSAGHAIDVAYSVARISSTNWYRPQTYGDTNTLVIEDCIFDFVNMADNCVDCYSGAKFVFRYNTLTNTCPGWHGADSDARGVRMFEVYGNKFYQKSAYVLGYMLLARSGSGVVWSNTTDAVCDGKSPLYMRQYRATASYTPSSSQTDFLPSGGLQGSMNGSRIVDGNFDASGYPGLDQIGRGSFTNNPVVWTATFTAADYEQFEGVYLWSNNINGNLTPLATAAGYDNEAITNVIRAGRDYFDNTQKPNYTPLVYPHPLQGLATVKASLTGNISLSGNARIGP